MWKNKGLEKIMAVYWFTILFIVAGGIVLVVVNFYGDPYDVRNVEGDLLASHIADCLSDGGELNPSLFKQESGNFVFDESFRDNFLDNCDLTFEVEDTEYWEENQYFVRIEIFDFDRNKEKNLGNKRFTIEKGAGTLESFCFEQNSKVLPTCIERYFYSLGLDGKGYTIKVLSVVRKTEKNVR